VSVESIRDRLAEYTALENVALSRKEGWREFVTTEAIRRPEVLTRSRIRTLSDADLEVYNYARSVWHANLGPIRTPQLAELHQQLTTVVGSNRQTGDKAKSALAIDAFPGLGKTTAVLAYAKAFHHSEIRLKGEFTRDGHERWPVCRVGITGNTGLRDFNKAMLEFYGHPGANRGTAADFSRRALDCVTSCETRLLVVDDLHFLRMHANSGVEISNHFKYIANEFPVTIVFIGVKLRERGLFADPQMARRTTKIGVRPFAVDNEAGRREWRTMLLAVEQGLVLAEAYPGMVADDLSDYLFARTSGHIQSLMVLINRGCHLAVDTGVERLDMDLLDRVSNDQDAERTRRELQAALDSRRITTRPSMSGT
jgi:hypothetical protein